MSDINSQRNGSESSLRQWIEQVLTSFPFPLPPDGSDLTRVGAFNWLSDVKNEPLFAPLLWFEASLRYNHEHMDSLSGLVESIANSPVYRNNGELSIDLLRAWREIQGKVLVEAVAPEIERIAGDVLTNVYNSRTRIGDILEKWGPMNYVKAGIAAGSFGIMGLFQYRFMESLLHAFAQADINQGKTWAIVQLVQNNVALAWSGLAWSILTTCSFAYLVKEGFETHLSDKLMGTSRHWKKTLCGLGCLALLGVEMTGSLSRITIGTDLKEQVVDMKKWLQKATQGNTTVFATLTNQANTIGWQYAWEWEKMFNDEMMARPLKSWKVWPFAAAKQASYVPRSQIKKPGEIEDKKQYYPTLLPKVWELYSSLQKHSDTMIQIQNTHGITVNPSSNELSAPETIYDAGFHVSETAKKLSKDATTSVDKVLDDHNLINPAFTDVIMDLVFDAGKKLHPDDVNTLRADLDRKIASAGQNTDQIAAQLDATIDTIDSFMKDMVESANKAYPNSPSTYTPKQKPPKIDTSSLKKALDSTKVPVTVLDPYRVWGKYFELTGNDTIPASYSWALVLRVMLVELLLFAIGCMRVRKTRKALSTPGARFEDLARETDGQYLAIVERISRLTGGDAWKMLNGKSLTKEEIHTIITTALTSESDTWLWNHMSVVDDAWKKVNSRLQSVREYLGAAFMWQYSAPEIRRIRDLDNSLVNWREDLTGEEPKQDKKWVDILRLWANSIWRKRSEKDEENPSDGIAPFSLQWGNNRIVGAIEDILHRPGALKNISDATQKRHSLEKQRQKKREWNNVYNSISTFFQKNWAFLSEIGDVRADARHPLYTSVKILDETGDIFGYYTDELKELRWSYRKLLWWKTEKDFVAQKDTYNRDTARAIHEKLSRLQASWVFRNDINTTRQLNSWLKINPSELLEEVNHKAIIGIFESVKDIPYISSSILTDNPWNRGRDMNRGVYEDGIRAVSTNLQQARDITTRIRMLEEYVEVWSERVTELQMMSLRSAAAQIKNYFEQKA